MLEMDLKARVANVSLSLFVSFSAWETQFRNDKFLSRKLTLNFFVTSLPVAKLC